MCNMIKRAQILLTGAAVLLLAACPGSVSTDGSGYTITINSCANGSISADRETARAGEIITLSITPDGGYELASIHVTGDIALDGSGNIRAFLMPAQDVIVSALFVPAGLPKYGIAIHEMEGGVIESSPAGFQYAGMGVTLIARPQHGKKYRPASLAVWGKDSQETVMVASAEDSAMTWVFQMPAESVEVDASFIDISYCGIHIAGGMENGVCTIDGMETEGEYAGKAGEGAVITLTALPDSGYKVANGEPFVIPSGAVSFTPVEGRAAWTFIMPDTELEIGIAFAALGVLDIYKGGARKGITVGGLIDDNKFYRDCINMESEEPGHNDNRRVIKITTALNANGNAVQQSFGLFSDTEIDLENVAALSFWAKANKSQNIRYVGFGDADPNKRVVYIGENYNHTIPLTTEWKRCIVPIPAAGGGLKTTRVFLFNANVARDNYICIDDIEFIESGVKVTDINIPDVNEARYYGATAAATMLKGADIAVSYTCDDGTVATLQCRRVTGTLKYDLAEWLTPFIRIDGDAVFADGVVYPKANSGTLALSVNMGGITSNPMMVTVIDGLLLDDFEDMEGDANVSIPANPGTDKGYIWHTSAGGYVLIRDYVSTVNSEIYSGLGSGNWRPNATSANPRGGRNFEAKDAAGYTALQFRIRVTAGTAISENFHTGAVFTFELKNGGELTSKTEGDFFSRQFTYDTAGWQEVTVPLAGFADAGLDVSAITGYAFGVVDRQGSALRISLDDIAFVK